MYFATLLKTTAPVKLPISQLSLFFLKFKVNTNPILSLRFPLIVYRLTYSLLNKIVLDSCDN